MKIQFSKILTFFSTVILIICLIRCCTVQINDGYDTGLYVGITSGAFTFCLTTYIWYFKKAEQENISNIRAGMYKTVSEERLKYNKEMLLFLKENKLTENDLVEIDSDSPLRDFTDSALNEYKDETDKIVNDSLSDMEVYDGNI